MMRTLFFFFLLSLPLFATEVIQHTIYEKKESVDIMLTFDAPYGGKIIQKKTLGDTILILQGITLPQKITKEINSSIVQSLSLVSDKEQLQIELSAKNAFEVDASKTVDNYGLRLRIKPEHLLTSLSPIKARPFETKKGGDIEDSFYKLLLIFAVLIAFLYMLKKWIGQKSGDLHGNWLFDKNRKNNSIKIIHQRALDTTNRVTLISYADKEYLLVLGNNNLLLDTFENSNSDSFDNILSENEEALNGFIQQKNKQT